MRRPREVPFLPGFQRFGGVTAAAAVWPRPRPRHPMRLVEADAGAFFRRAGISQKALQIWTLRRRASPSEYRGLAFRTNEDVAINQRICGLFAISRGKV